MSLLLTIEFTAKSLKLAYDAKQFVEEGQLCKSLTEISLNEVKSAEHTLANIDYAHNYREALNRALTHLESAHEHTSSIIKKQCSPTLNPYSEGDYRRQIVLDVHLCCLISICHFYLQDDREIIRHFLLDAQESWTYTDVSSDSTLGLFSALFQIGRIGASDRIDEAIKQEFDETLRLCGFYKPGLEQLPDPYRIGVVTEKENDQKFVFTWDRRKPFRW